MDYKEPTVKQEVVPDHQRSVLHKMDHEIWAVFSVPAQGSWAPVNRLEKYY